MDFLSIIYQLLFMPLQIIFEVIYYLVFKLTGNPGVSIIGLSFIVNLLVLPLYNRADAMQEAERDIELKLKKGVDHIKKTFKGDEQLMMLQTYYRQNNYSPLDSIKGSISLFLEIPFFVAAYQFLSHLALLNGASLGPVKDLGLPDALLNIAGISVNVLPFIMTAVNLVSAYIFTKDLTRKTKMQLYGMAGFFLVFLYSSPSALVVYWTLNNIFNLVKTVICKMSDVGKGINIAMFVCSTIVAVYGLLVSPNYKQALNYILLAIVLNGRFILQIISSFLKKNHHGISVIPSTKTFIAGACFLALLIGAVIPSAVIESSPQDFLVNDYSFNPLFYIGYSTAIAAGSFVIWGGVFYWLASPDYKVSIERIVWALSGTSLVNYMFFGKKLGVLSSTLRFEAGLRLSSLERSINAGIFIILLVVLNFLWKKYRNNIFDVLTIGIAALSAMVIINVNSIYNVLDGVVESQSKQVKSSSVEKVANTAAEKKLFTLSKNGKNVMVFMLDMAIGSYVPYFMNEKPELKDAFAGFTYYANTISFGAHTNIGTPGLFGGYEYTPAEINKRDKEALVAKHNEALKVMPVLFGQEGFKVTFCDPPLANYGMGNGLAIFDEYPYIKAYHLWREYENLFPKNENISSNAVAVNKRNFYFFGLLKSAPLFMQKYIYDKGGYLSGEIIGQEITTLYTSLGLRNDFVRDIFCLDTLAEMTQVVDEGDNLMIVVNQTPHFPCLLQLPDYLPNKRVDNTKLVDYNSSNFIFNGKKLKIVNERQVSHYHANMATLIKMGEWFDYLRANGIYDNTRIILVADHGDSVRHFSDWRIGKESLEMYYPLLMVKDFGQTEFKTSNAFMTNADVVTIASKGVIENPVNPFTNKRIGNSEKFNGKQYILASHANNVGTNNGNTFVSGKWYSVHTDIWNLDNWQIVQEDAVLPY